MPRRAAVTHIQTGAERAAGDPGRSYNEEHVERMKRFDEHLEKRRQENEAYLNEVLGRRRR
ncbi:hypothetical protein [Streptomyces sp. cg35]|uniref:hypothetical protein n=1 Tax=Streptomyces sp. cg35 TaxID=3421650 RepID=UPI003D17834E